MNKLRREIGVSLIEEAIINDKNLNILVNSLPAKAEIVKKSNPKETENLKKMLVDLINLADLFVVHNKDFRNAIAQLSDIGLRTHFTQGMNMIVANLKKYENLLAIYS